MVKIKFAAFAVLVVTLITFAQTFAQNREVSKSTPEEKATKMTDRMKENLSLTDQQYKEVYSLILTKIQDRKANKEKYKAMDQETRKQLRKQHKDEMKLQFERILNPDQMTKMKEMKSKHRKEKGKHNKGQHNERRNKNKDKAE
ncbi:MAG: hypothetical protein ABIY50_09840 [Ignavibacteria bacterium]